MAAASSTSESSPLLQSSTGQATPTPKASRTVTFNPTVSTASPPKRRPVFPSNGHSLSSNAIPAPFSTLNSRLRRRNSSGAALQQLPPQHPVGKIGPQRTTRTAQKLKLLPDPEHEEDVTPGEESGRDVYSQFTRIKDPTARRDAARLGKDDRKRLPRVTAYCTASSYRLDELLRFLKGRSRSKGASPKSFDECIYSPYSYRKEAHKRRGSGSLDSDGDAERLSESVPTPLARRYSDSAIQVEENMDRRRTDLMDLQTAMSSVEDPTAASGDYVSQTPTALTSASSPSLPTRPMPPDFDTSVHIPEVFLFEYGVVVIWGMTTKEEHRFLKELAKFEQEKLAPPDVQTEEFNFYYTREYQARIYNDFISLRDKRNYMTKLAISHALAQSTKVRPHLLTLTHRSISDRLTFSQTSLYEDLLDATITTTQSIPATIARTGRVNLSRRQINMQIGELFILRINIHLQGSVLDAPELLWAEPRLEPVYQAVRSYLEMDQRVGLLQERVGVIADLLAVLKDQLGQTHGRLSRFVLLSLLGHPLVHPPSSPFCPVRVGESGARAGRRTMRDSVLTMWFRRVSRVDRHHPDRGRNRGRCR